jgi:predicted AAA+ superfamily ATPase
MIDRKDYFDRLLGYKDKKIIKVITGIRRCGKSTLLDMYQKYLLKNGIDKSQIISINFEDYEFDELKNPKELYQYIKDRLLQNKMVYIFLDEIQNVQVFQ